MFSCMRRYARGMAIERMKDSKAQTLTGTSIVLVIAAILFIAIGVPTESYGMAIFGSILLVLALVVGLIGMGMHWFRR